ncbi:MAG: uroporphyrinogen decarboxylase [Deltaproteobacteria bacterium]|nr:uroporphyrinogen decarboxylase [Deltaproteobacteria bacterium]
MNDAFLRVCNGEAVRPVPVWLMRQAGRYLPAYQEIRKKTDFLTLCKTPELAAEVTIQPVDILGVDAAILFSDILIPLECMGIGLDFHEGRGPVLNPPVRTEQDIERLHPIDPDADVSFVLETIRILRKELSGKVPLIGFSGAPFTLATYMIEGGTSKSFVNTKRMLFESPHLFSRLMDLLTEVVLSYIKAQIKAGAQAIQVFDTWAGTLTREDYERHALPYLTSIFKGLEGSGVPFIYFVFNGGHLLEIVRDSGAEVIGLDWRTDIKTAISRLGPDAVVQGNLDPGALFLPEHELRSRVDSVLRQGREAKAHIFNLGHGILPEIPPEKARLLVELVHELSS